MDFITFIHDFIVYSENHPDENYTILDIFKGISERGIFDFLATSSLPYDPSGSAGNHTPALNVKNYENTYQNSLNNSDDQQNSTSISSLTDSVSAQSSNPINLIALVLVLLVVLVGVRIKRAN